MMSSRLEIIDTTDRMILNETIALVHTAWPDARAHSVHVYSFYGDRDDLCVRTHQLTLNIIFARPPTHRVTRQRVTTNMLHP